VLTKLLIVARDRRGFLPILTRIGTDAPDAQ